MINNTLKERFAAKASNDAGFAIAYALMELVDVHFSVFKNLDESLRSDHPLQGETLSGIEDALREIAHDIAHRIDMLNLDGISNGLDAVADAIKDAK